MERKLKSYKNEEFDRVMNDVFGFSPFMKSTEKLDKKGPSKYYSVCCGGFIAEWENRDYCPICHQPCEIEVG